MVVPVEIDPLDGMALVDSGLILTSEAEDRDAISRAFRLLLDSTVVGRKARPTSAPRR